jgi:Amt family ammonium transporter
MNGTLAGLVAITAGCAFVSPLAAILIGLPAGILFILAGDVVEKMKVDDAVGAFAVHGVCGITGILAIGLWADPSLTYVGAMAGNAGLLMGGGLDLLGVQAVGSLSTIAYVTVTSVIMFGALKAINRLRVNAKGDEIGIDVYEHGASLWPDVLPYPGEEPVTVRSTGPRAAAPAVGD